jgi:aminoglycoside phosphotransferase (APT) family kinase protein
MKPRAILHMGSSIDGRIVPTRWPKDGDRLRHGDFHPQNIVGPIGRETILDWLDASRGDPAADVCRTYVLIKPVSEELAAAYVEAYAALGNVSRDDIMNWLPLVAAARLAEGVEDESSGIVAHGGGEWSLKHLRSEDCRRPGSRSNRDGRRP